MSPNSTTWPVWPTRGVEIRSFKNGALILTLTNAGEGRIQFSPDSQRLVTTRDSGLALWNTRTWQQEAEIAGVKLFLAFTPGMEKASWHATTIISRSGAFRIPARSRTSPEPTCLHTSIPIMAVSPDGNRVFLGNTNRIRVWDLRSQTELDAIRLATTRPLSFVTVSPQGLLAGAEMGPEGDALKQ